MEAHGADREVALRRAIVERPESDELRLIYADWCEDAGDPERAELIRIAVELAATPEAPGRRGLELRREAIEGRLIDTWPRPDGLGIEVRRGLPGLLRGSAEALAELAPHMVAEYPIERIEILVDDGDLGRLAGSPALARIRELAINDSDPGAVAALLSRGLDRLEALVISTGDPLKLAAAVAGCPLEKLRRLSFGTDAGEPGGPAALELLVAAPGLRGLRDLEAAGWDGDYNGVIAAIGAHLPDFERLAIFPWSMALVAGSLATLPPLEALEITDSDIGGAAIEALARGGGLARLVKLDLSEAALGSGGLGPLIERGAPRLRELVVERSGIGRPDVVGLAYSDGLGALVRLTLGDSPMNGEAIEALARSPLFYRLEQLQIDNCGIDDGQLAILAGGSAPRLESLSLDHNGFGDRGLEALLAGSLLDLVVDLSLSHVQITDRSAASLLEAPALLELCLYGCPISRNLAAKLANRFELLF